MIELSTGHVTGVTVVARLLQDIHDSFKIPKAPPSASCRVEITFSYDYYILSISDDECVPYIHARTLARTRCSPNTLKPKRRGRVYAGIQCLWALQKTGFRRIPCEVVDKKPNVCAWRGELWWHQQYCSSRWRTHTHTHAQSWDDAMRQQRTLTIMPGRRSLVRSEWWFGISVSPLFFLVCFWSKLILMRSVGDVGDGSWKWVWRW